MVRTHLTPTPRTAVVDRMAACCAMGLAARDDRMSWPPVAAE